jgi:hypothetical protein
VKKEKLKLVGQRGHAREEDNEMEVRLNALVAKTSAEELRQMLVRDSYD